MFLIYLAVYLRQICQLAPSDVHVMIENQKSLNDKPFLQDVKKHAGKLLKNENPEKFGVVTRFDKNFKPDMQGYVFNYEIESHKEIPALPDDAPQAEELITLFEKLEHDKKLDPSLLRDDNGSRIQPYLAKGCIQKMLNVVTGKEQYHSGLPPSEEDKKEYRRINTLMLRHILYMMTKDPTIDQNLTQ